MEVQKSKFTNIYIQHVKTKINVVLYKQTLYKAHNMQFIKNMPLAF